MLRSFTCLLLAILSLSHYIDCADNDTQNAPGVLAATVKNGWTSHDLRERGPITFLWYSSELDYLFYYLTYDKSKDYFDVTQVATRNSNGAKKTCRVKFAAADKDIKIINISGAKKEKDAVIIEYSTTETRAREIDFKKTLNFNKCAKSSAPGAMASPVPVEEDREEVKAEAQPLAAPTKGKTVESEAKQLKANCQLNDKGTELTCTQKDWHDKVLINNVKYTLPKDWNADWWAIHNANAGAIVVFFSSCPHEYCMGYTALRLMAKGVTEGPFTNQGMDLDCHHMADLKVDFTDHSGGWSCMHAVCPEPLYRKQSETLVETNLRYREHCMKGDIVN